MAFLTSASVEAGCIFVTKSANRKASCVGAVLQLGIYLKLGGRLTSMTRAFSTRL